MNRNRLLALVTANKDRAKRHEILNADGKEATVYLYDLIDADYGISPEAFVKAFNAITAPTIHLRINSPGGDAFGGRAMATAISQHKSNVIAHVDGLAASAASYVAIAADSVEMAPGSFMMIHKAFTLAFGNADDLLSTAALLEKVDASLAADYAKKTGKPQSQIAEWMSAETWFTAEESVDQGFANSVAKTEAEGVENAWDLSVYDHAPKKEPKKLALTADESAQLVTITAKEIEALAAEAAANEQASLDHADRVRRFGLLTATA